MEIDHDDVLMASRTLIESRNRLLDGVTMVHKLIDPKLGRRLDRVLREFDDVMRELDGFCAERGHGAAGLYGDGVTWPFYVPMVARINGVAALPSFPGPEYPPGVYPNKQ